SLQILIATDVAARGIDVKDITHVINYKLPDEAQIYTHRSGRTARAGKSGISIVIINSREKRKLEMIEKKAGVQFTYSKIPNGYEICEKQLYSMIYKMVEVDVDYEEIEPFLPPVYDTLSSLSKEDLIKRFVSIEFNRFLDYYRDSKDINASLSKGKRSSHDSKSGDRQSNIKPGNAKRFFLNAGEMDNLDKKTLIKTLCKEAGINPQKIGPIEIMREFSFFEVESGVAAKVLKTMSGARINGRDINVEYAEKKKKKSKHTKKRKKKKKRY
ncbi:DbpA RNA binding domain-containing protein, partial [Thermodesulfobacteriota bacterium]